MYLHRVQEKQLWLQNQGVHIGHLVFFYPESGKSEIFSSRSPKIYQK